MHLFVPLTGKRVREIRPETLFHTLFADFFSEADGTTYVQTGDIPAMWLRDSSAQTLPYVRFIDAYPVLAARFSGVIERNAKNVLVDPYANGFSANYRPWERKWEAGGLAWPVLLTWVYWQRTHLHSVFTPAVHKSLRKIVDTWRCEQLHARCSKYVWRGTSTSEAFNPDTGMVWTAFRPSDDPVRYRFNIPQEAIIAVALGDIARLALDGYGDRNLANEANAMAAQVQAGIEQFGRVWKPEFGGWVYAYETDGLGRDIFMDDANIPNLTALPYLGYCAPSDPVYLNTRAYALSKRNPYYYNGKYASGLGSPHTPAGFVWPLGIIARAITATSAEETAESMTELAETDSEQGLIHESFDANAYWIYTRAEFGWGNASYAELIFRSVAGMPATPFTVYGETLDGAHVLRRTPVLTRPLAQIANAGMIYTALGNLLEQADGRTTIPPIRRLMQRSAP